MAKQSQITNFLKKVKEVEFPEIQITESVEIHKQFYEDCMKDCQNETCIAAKSAINKKKEEIRGRIQNIEEAIRICKLVVSEKDDEIDRLKKQVGEIAVNTNAASIDTLPAQPNISEENLLKSFLGFSANFTEDELSNLRSISADNSGDSTFVAHCVKYLYKQNLSALKNKSVTGKSRTPGQVKEPVTPAKYETLSEIFRERVNITSKNKNEIEARAKGINKFIKDAIMNVNRSNQTNEIEEKACKQLVSSLQKK